jgi:sn-glycerol 3-phosphate transport system ATP-binding protein
VLVGPSGCGKSTILRMIAGLETITEGEVPSAIASSTSSNRRTRHRHGVPELRALPAHDGARQHGLRAEEPGDAEGGDRKARIAEAARTSCRSSPISTASRAQLSGGQRQRVAMGRAIVREPAVFLFDEPLSNLDAKLRVQMRVEIKALQRKLGVTSLYVTHDQVEAMTWPTIGAPLEVYANPATLFVAGFIGSPPMNVLSHDIRPGRGPLDPGAVIGIRPEHIDLVAPGAGLIDFDVAFCEPLGAETLVHGVTAAGDKLVVRIDGETSLPADGTRVGLAIDPARILAFDAAGRRTEV